MQLLSSSALKSLRCSVWLMHAKHVLADGIHSLTIHSASLNYFYVPHAWLGSQLVSLSDLSLENSGVYHSSTHLIFHLTKHYVCHDAAATHIYMCMTWLNRKPPVRQRADSF